MNKFNVLVTGANGQLGHCLQDAAKDSMHNIIFATSKDLDITDSNAIKDWIERNDINVIINAAAYTKVDKAEDEASKAWEVNCLAVRELAKIARDHDCLLIHVSTDYVFSGKTNTAYMTYDPTLPDSVYGNSKLGGEKELEMISDNAIIVRTSWLYSEYGSNFMKTILRISSENDSIKVVNDQIGCPTYAGDLARFLLLLVDSKDTGIRIYHYSNEGVCSWFDLAKSIIELSGSNCKIIPIRTSEFPTRAKRPVFSLLDLEETREITDIPYWRDSLKVAISNLKSMLIE